MDPREKKLKNEILDIQRKIRVVESEEIVTNVNIKIQKMLIRSLQGEKVDTRPLAEKIVAYVREHLK